jgi:hypothetical protein
MAIVSLTGDATRPVGRGTNIIAHVCNDHGRWGTAGIEVTVYDRG